MIRKVGGAISFFLGLLLIIGIPDIGHYQSEQTAKAGILVGIILIGLGVYLMKT